LACTGFSGISTRGTYKSVYVYRDDATTVTNTDDDPNNNNPSDNNT
jgi:hypothetical protein